MSRKSFIRASAGLTFLIIVLQSVWAMSMPAFRGPDEPHHVNSIMRIVSGDGWPEPGDAMVDPVIVQAGHESGIITPGATHFTSTYRTRLLHSRPINPYFADMVITPHDSRSPLYPVSKADPAAHEVDQMTQHPPLYYAGGAAIVKAFDLQDAPWDRLIQALRLYGIALTIPLVPATIYTARRLGASRHWSLLAGLVPLAIPQVFGITAVVTNDTLAIGTGALVVAALAKAGTERITWKTVLFVGGALGLALWSKGLLLAFGLPLVLVFLFARHDTWKRRLTAALASGTIALTIGFWWVLNLVRYGVVQPAGYSRPVPESWDPANASFMHYFSTAFRTFTTSFFSSFGWLEADFPSAVTWGLLILFAAAIVWSVIQAGRARTTYLILLSPFVGLIVLLYAQGWFNYLSTSVVAGVQGRYLYPCLAAFGGIVLGLRRWGPRGYRAFGLFAIATGMFGFVWLLRSCYPGPAVIDFARYADVVGVPVSAIIVMLAAYLLATITLVSLVVRWSRGAAMPSEYQATLVEENAGAGDGRNEP